MKSPSDPERQAADLRAKILGLGERSIRKSYYPVLRRQMDQLERYRALLNQATNAICLLSLPALRFLDSNPSACQLFGFEVARQAEHKLTALVDSETAFAIEQWVGSEPGDTAQHIHLEACANNPRGVGTMVDIWLTRVNFVEDDFIVCVAQDITERKDAETKLHQALADTEAAKSNIDNILRSMGDGLLVVAPDGRISLLNPAAEEIFGLSLSAARNHSYREIVGEDGLQEQIAEILNGETRSLLCEWETETGGERYVFRAKTSPVLGPSKSPSGAITSLRDITREKELDRIKNEFISAAAHELRTPLTSLIGYAELLSSAETFGTFPEEQQKEFLSIICDKSMQLSALVDDLLDLSRVQSGKLIVLHPQPGQLDVLLREVLDDFRQSAPEHRFRLSLPQRPLDFVFDAAKITQLLENLIGNAVKFSPAGSEITLAANTEENFCRITVEDQGLGIPDSHLDRVFDKFYRVNASDSGYAGLGLGLSIAQQIVEAHGGNISVESEEHRGTRVTFTLPLSI